MNDPLKKYIKTHREDFDSEEPDPALWERIAQDIAARPPGRRRPLRSFRWGLAAAAVVLAIVSVSLFFTEQGVRPQGPVAARLDTVSVGASPGASADTLDEATYDQEMYHFSRIIDIKFREIEKIKGAHPELYQRFSADLQKLDTAYRQLKQQLPSQPNQELLLKAMLQNLTLQVDLINRQLGIIEQLKSVSHAMPVTHI